MCTFVFMIPFKATYRKSIFHRRRTVSFNVPRGYDEITIGQYIDILKWDGKSLLDVVGILTGLPDEIIQNTDVHQVAQDVVKYLNWVTVPPQFMDTESEFYCEFPVPDTIKIGFKQYTVPKDITLETFGQKISLQVHLKMAQKDELSLAETIPMALAIYFYPIVSGKPYDEDRARELLPLIKKVNLLDAYVVSAFFLNNSRKSLTKNVSKSPIKGMPSRVRRMLKSLNPLGYLGRWMPWRKVTCSSMTTYCCNDIRTYSLN